MSRLHFGSLSLRVSAIVCLAFVVAGPTSAHEVRPALLQLTEVARHRFDVLWKQPLMGSVGVHLVPRISGGLLEQVPGNAETTADFRIVVWHELDAGTERLEGRSLSVEGLNQTITDVLISIQLLDGRSIQEVLHPRSTGLVIHSGGNGLVLPAYIKLGVEHILTGPDHLAFVLGLMLLASSWRALIQTITAFTVAHSLTLAAVALHLLDVRPALIEALVALSIILLAVEIVHRYRGQIGLSVRFPWLIALTFGLLHGAAFAGALEEVGLPPHSLLLSLFLFNVGVEVGQLCFVASVLGIAWIVRTHTKLPSWTRWVPPYAVGSLAAFWFLDRLATALG